MPALTSNSALAVAGIRHLGYPDYFRNMLTVFKVAGAIALIVPAVSERIKEWAYAGFGLSMIAAFISLCSVDGFKGQSFFPLFVLAILAVSYVFYHKRNQVKNTATATVKTTNYVVPGVSQ